MVAPGKNEDRAYITNIGSGSPSVLNIDTGAWKVIKRFKTGATPDGIAYFRLGQKMQNKISILRKSLKKRIACYESYGF